jgi:hypothetical protein
MVGHVYWRSVESISHRIGIGKCIEQQEYHLLETAIWRVRRSPST